MKLENVASLILSACGLLAGAAGCGGETSQAAPPAPPTVTVAKPVVREVLDYDQYTGKLAAVEEVEIRSRVKGYLDTIGFTDGDEVKKGQVLFQIDPRPFDAAVKMAQGQLDQVKARRSRADSDVKRYKDLVPKGAAPQQDLDKAIAEFGEAEAGISAAEAEVERAKLEQAYAKIEAPIDGLTSKSQLRVGSLVGAASGGEELLTTLVRVDPIHVYFDVDQRALQHYRSEAIKRRAASGQPEPKTARELNIRFQFGLAGDEGFPNEGVIDFVDNKVNPTSGTMSVRGEAKNAERRFRPGFFARVRVAAGDNYKAVLVSERAIGTQQGQKYVLVVDDKDTVVFRPVQLGAPQSDGLRVSRSGLKADERVVVNGIQRARPGSIVKAEVGEMPVHKPPTTAPAAVAQSNNGR
jgi:RND family efflux transporter MFP subunit